MHRFSRCIRCRAALIGGLCAVLLLAWSGCRPEEHYDVLSIFFDDPPRPIMPTTGPSTRPAIADAGMDSLQTFKVLHQPFAEKQCQTCHTGEPSNPGLAFQAGKCIACHKPTMNKHVVMHAPVTDGKCLWCHAAHGSNFGSLLRVPSPRMCVQCHDSELLSPRTDGHRPGGPDCMSCHLAHGGRDRRILRDR